MPTAPKKILDSLPLFKVPREELKKIVKGMTEEQFSELSKSHAELMPYPMSRSLGQ